MTQDQNITPAILDHTGRKARTAASDACPQCGAGEDKRRASGGFGTPWMVCGACGYEWKDRVFRG